MGHIPRVLIAGTQSGSGKTTITCGLIAALRQRGLKCVAFKIGPDYIDPGHLRRAGGGEIPVYNLDTWMLNRDTAKEFFAESTHGADIAIVEGVMGLYDGGQNGISSSADIAKLLELPVVLAINTRSMGESAAALALGFREYDKNVDLRGVILNGLGSDSHRAIITNALDRVGVPVLGALTRDANLSLPERHLGLVPTEELQELPKWGDRARIAVESSVNIDALLAIAQSAPSIDTTSTTVVSTVPNIVKSTASIRIAIARDEAFSFYYPESLRLLERMGAELVNFSPLADAAPPRNIHGMMFGGGFPEVFAERLEANTSMREALRDLFSSGLPTLAECGGFMYLGQTLTDFDGRTFEMVGVVPATSQMAKKLQTVGYVEATMLRDTILGPAGTVLHGHEFHFSTMRFSEANATGEADGEHTALRLVRRSTGAAHDGGYATKNLLASYLHLNMLGHPEVAVNFLQQCVDYHNQNFLEKEKGRLYSLNKFRGFTADFGNIS